LTVEQFAREIGTFFLAQWQAAPMPAKADPMTFFVAGYDDGDTYGRVFEVVIPGTPEPVEKNPNTFGLLYGGQWEITGRIMSGYDPKLPEVARKALTLSDAQVGQLTQALSALQLPIPMEFLPLQDCVDLVIFLIEATASLQTWMLGVRGVGGAIDVATITGTEGFRALQRKQVRGHALIQHQR
jgi:hypothetical protein